MQHVLPLDLSAGSLSGPEEIPESSIVVELKVDSRRHQEVQGDNAPSRAMNLAVSVAPQQHRGDDCLPEMEGSHVFVGAVVHNVVQREIAGTLAATIGHPPVDAQRQAGYRSRDDSDACPHGGQAHGLVDTD
ncbi:hypothetical protein D3C76_1371040 [compost metagenome]